MSQRYEPDAPAQTEVSHNIPTEGRFADHILVAALKGADRKRSEAKFHFQGAVSKRTIRMQMGRAVAIVGAKIAAL